MMDRRLTTELQRDSAAAGARLTPFLAFTVGVIVLPLYAAQPLLGMIGASLDMPVSTYGVIAMMSMAGYATGLFLLVPLTDLVELRRVTLATVSGEVLALIAAALAPSATFFCVAAFAVGATASSIQMLVPAAAGLVRPQQRGRVIGKVMSGLMIGILLSRPIASLAAESFGWRGAFAIDAMGLLPTWVGLYRVLPFRRPGQSLPYRALLGSLVDLLVTEPALRRRAAYQALCMAAFGIFWSGVGLRLSQPPFGIGQTGLALFALAGAGGAIIAPIAGWLGDRGWNVMATRAAHGAVLAASVLAAIAGCGWLDPDPVAHRALALALLAFSAVLLDVGVIGDQTLGRRIVNLVRPDAQGRVNGIYTGLFFVGGSLGSALAGVAWATMGWWPLCAIGAGFGVLALGLSMREVD